VPARTHTRAHGRALDRQSGVPALEHSLAGLCDGLEPCLADHGKASQVVLNELRNGHVIPSASASQICSSSASRVKSRAIRSGLVFAANLVRSSYHNLLPIGVSSYVLPRQPRRSPSSGWKSSPQARSVNKLKHDRTE
jgi:hypothetical protein